jgi:pectate lyase
MSPIATSSCASLFIAVLGASLVSCGGGTSSTANADASPSVATGSPAPSSPQSDPSREVAPADGWAGQGGGTSGGSGADAGAVYEVGSPSQLKAALAAAGSSAKIIKINGSIDMASADNGGPFTSAADQAARSKVVLPSNTTLIGVGSTAGFVNATLIVKAVGNVIVRNLLIVNPCDIAPVWDPSDGSSGNWNSQYDGITVDGAKNVWIDHNRFTDAPQTDDLSPIENGKLKQCHDGAVDIKNAADYITVSYNEFDQHDKNNLIGSSDSSTGDDGHLTVTFHHNHFSNVTQRAPRVRFGRVHLFSNYFEGSRSHPVYPHAYSIGVGYKAQILSENNVFDIAGATGCPDVVKNPGSSSQTGAISDSGSLLNGVALDVANACSFTAAGWTIPYAYSATPAADVKRIVVPAAGVGKLQ